MVQSNNAERTLMKKFLAIGVGAALLAGCGEKTVETPEQLQEVFAAPPPSGVTNAQAEQVNMLVGQAVTALQKKDEVSAVVALQTLRDTPDLTVDQYMAVQEMMSNAQQSIAARAAAGDPAALAAMEALKYKHRR